MSLCDLRKYEARSEAFTVPHSTAQYYSKSNLLAVNVSDSVIVIIQFYKVYDLIYGLYSMNYDEIILACNGEM